MIGPCKLETLLCESEARGKERFIKFIGIAIALTLALTVPQQVQHKVHEAKAATDYPLQLS